MLISLYEYVSCVLFVVFRNCHRNKIEIYLTIYELDAIGAGQKLSYGAVILLFQRLVFVVILYLSENKQMNFPQIDNTNVSNHLNQADLVRQTAEQIMKDFGMFGVEITFSGNTESAYEELHKQLIDQITVLVERNYDLLLSVLYQVDITDREIYKAQQELPHYTNIEIIAHQVIVRDLKKVLLRKYFKMKDSSEKPGDIHLNEAK